LTTLATPVLAQTYPAYPVQGPVGSTPPPGYYYNGPPAGGYYNGPPAGGYYNGPPAGGPMMGAPTPVIAAGPAMVAPQAWCHVEKWEGGKLTAVCGPP
jgi:hypothetical protein